MESIKALRRWADALRCAWVNQGDGTITLTTGCDIPPNVDSVSLCDHVNGIIDDIEREVKEHYVPLPMDADGVPIHVGDVLDPPADCNDYVPLQVTRLMYDGYEHEWFFDGQAGGFCGLAGEHMDVAGWTHHHHHAKTVEDVLWDFVDAWAEWKDGAPMMNPVETFAAKLRLAEGVE